MIKKYFNVWDFNALGHDKKGIGFGHSSRDEAEDSATKHLENFSEVKLAYRIVASPKLDPVGNRDAKVIVSHGFQSEVAGHMTLEILKSRYNGELYTMIAESLVPVERSYGEYLAFVSSKRSPEIAEYLLNMKRRNQVLEKTFGNTLTHAAMKKKRRHIEPDQDYAEVINQMVQEGAK